MSRGRQVALDIRLERLPETVPADETVITGQNPLAGSSVANISPRVLDRLRVRYRGEGVIITEVQRGSPAARAGFRPGDILLKVNRNEIRSVDAVVEITASGGRSWGFEVNRRGSLIRQFFRG